MANSNDWCKRIDIRLVICRQIDVISSHRFIRIETASDYRLIELKASGADRKNKNPKSKHRKRFSCVANADKYVLIVVRVMRKLNMLPTAIRGILLLLNRCDTRCRRRSAYKIRKNEKKK